MTPAPNFPSRRTESKSPRRKSRNGNVDVPSPRGIGGWQDSTTGASSATISPPSSPARRGRSWVKSSAESFRRVASRRRRSRTVEKRESNRKEPLLVYTQFDDDDDEQLLADDEGANVDLNDFYPNDDKKNDSVEDDVLSSQYYEMFASSSPRQPPNSSSSRGVSGGFVKDQVKMYNNNSHNVDKGYEPPSIEHKKESKTAPKGEDDEERDYDRVEGRGQASRLSEESSEEAREQPAYDLTFPIEDFQETDATTRTRNIPRLNSISPRGNSHNISSFTRGRSLPCSPSSNAASTPKMGTSTGRRKSKTTTTVVLSTGNNFSSSVGSKDGDEDDDDVSVTSSWVVRKMLERDDPDHDQGRPEQPKNTHRRYVNDDNEEVDHNSYTHSVGTNTYTAGGDSNTFLSTQNGTMETMETMTTRDEETADGRGITALKARSTEEDTFLGSPSGDGTATVDGLFVGKQRVAYMCIILTTIQLGILITQLAMCGMASLNVNPLLGPYPDAFSYWGAKNSYQLVEGRQYFRLITPTLLHVGLLHLVANAYSQLETCAYLEREWGSFRWAVIYVLSAVGSSLTASTVDPDTIGVLSSGTLMGLFGAKIAQIFTWSVFELKHSALEDSVSFEHLGSVMCSAATVSLLSFFTYIDWSGHFGGLTTGFLIGMIVFSWAIKSKYSKMLLIVLAVAGLLIGTVFLSLRLFAAGTVLDEELGDACQYFRNLFPEGYECECAWD